MILRDSEVVEGACSEVLVTVTRVIQSPHSGVEADVSLIHARANTLNWESWVVVLASSATVYRARGSRYQESVQDRQLVQEQCEESRRPATSTVGQATRERFTAAIASRH